MDVRKAFNNKTNNSSTEQELTGWLVIIDKNLYLLEASLHSDYKQSLKIKISDKSIIYAILLVILPLGGGESFIFHRAKVSGFLHMGSSPEIVLKKLFIQERMGQNMIVVDISQSAIDAGKKNFEEMLNFDFFKEMGDK